jgi:hypothetical protein
VDTDTSPDHCGSCFNGCNDAEYCDNGTCACRPGLTDCNGNCTDLMNDIDHCGACNAPCDGVCVDGVCQGNVSCGQIGQQNCNDGCLTNAELDNSPINCGDCGEVCGADQVCANGNCRGYFAPPGCDACPCPQCGVGTSCCMFPGAGFPICVNGNSCPM